MLQRLRTLFRNYCRRRDATAIHNGELLHFAPRDGIYVYFRFNEEQRVMVVMNNEPNTVHLDSSRYAQGLAGTTGRETC